MKKILCLLITLFIMITCDKSPTDVDHVDSIELTPVELKIATGDTATISATLRNKAGDIIEDRPVSWSVQDTKIIEVTDGGKISAKKEGQTIIRAECAGVSAEATVHVFDFLGQALLENQSNHEAIKISWQLPEDEEGEYIATDSLGYYVLPQLLDGKWIIKAEYPYYKGLADTIMVAEGKPARPLTKFTLLQQLKFEVILEKQQYSVNDTIWIEFEATNLTDKSLLILCYSYPIYCRGYAIVKDTEPIVGNKEQGYPFDYTFHESGFPYLDARDFAPGETKLEKSVMLNIDEQMFIFLKPLYQYGLINVGETYQIYAGYVPDIKYPWEYFVAPSYEYYSTNPYYKIFNYSLYEKLEPVSIIITE